MRLAIVVDGAGAVVVGCHRREPRRVRRIGPHRHHAQVVGAHERVGGESPREEHLGVAAGGERGVEPRRDVHHEIRADIRKTRRAGRPEAGGGVGRAPRRGDGVARHEVVVVHRVRRQTRGRRRRLDVHIGLAEILRTAVREPGRRVRSAVVCRPERGHGRRRQPRVGQRAGERGRRVQHVRRRAVGDLRLAGKRREARGGHGEDRGRSVAGREAEEIVGSGDQFLDEQAEFAGEPRCGERGGVRPVRGVRVSVRRAPVGGNGRVRGAGGDEVPAEPRARDQDVRRRQRDHAGLVRRNTLDRAIRLEHGVGRHDEVFRLDPVAGANDAGDTNFIDRAIHVESR